MNLGFQMSNHFDFFAAFYVMKILVYNSVIVVVMLFFASCTGNRVKGEFTKDELAWLVYAPNQIVEFKDAEGAVTKLHVIFRTDLEHIKQYYPIEAEVALSDIDCMKSFRIYLLKDQNAFKRYLRIGEVYRSLDLIQPEKQMEIGGKVYYNVYKVVEDTTLPNKPYIWRALFNKEAGIIEFTTLNNKTYRLQ
jgi:hypothetical protein